MSPPGHSRGGPLTTDRPSAENPGEKFTSESTPAIGQSPVWHAVATVYRVRGVRGRLRSVLVVATCPWCRCSHVHTGKPDFLVGKRTASCHGGRYVVHTGVLEGEVAA